MEDRHRGLVKWYDRGLQNLWWEFDSLVPCENALQAKQYVWFAEHLFIVFLRKADLDSSEDRQSG